MLHQMTRIGIDCRFASGLGGLGTYTRELVTALVARNDPWTYVLFVSSPDKVWHQHLSCEKIVVPYRHYTLSEQIFLPGLYRASHIDVLFAPHFSTPLLSRIPTVCTIHDLILHHYPNQASLIKRIAYRMLFAHAVNHSAHILSVSEATKTDLMAAYPSLRSEKVTVAYPGVSPLFHPADTAMVDQAKAQYGLTKPYFLYVGNCKQHKNVPLLLSAFQSLQSLDTELILVTSGKEADHLSLPAGVRILRDMSFASLPALYTGAIACVTASLFEGFGLPVIEAMACGCPVIAPNRTSIPEVSCGKATLLEPTSEAFAAAMRHHMAAPCDRQVLAQGWHERYDWKKTAQKTAAIFARMIES